MYVRKEVVNEGVQGGKRAYLLGGELGWMGRLQRMGGMDRRLRRGPRGLCLSNSSLFYGFRMFIGWTASSTWAVEGTRYLEAYTGFAWRSGLIALGICQQTIIEYKTTSRLTFTLRMLHESQALRRRLGFDSCGNGGFKA
jgi:hypothetical protein